MDSQTENKLLRKALSLYAGKRVLNLLLKNGEEALKPSSEKLVLTMVFVDIVPYTEADPDLSPEHLREVLAEYYELITSIVAQHNGIFDSFVGDSASAFWGLNGSETHPTEACNCAIELGRAIDKINSKSSKISLPSIALKIGINTGLVRVGNFGSSQRIKYTVMGSAVNLASRLSGLAFGELPGTILISQTTNEHLGPAIATEFYQSVNVKGEREKIELYKIAF